MTAYLITQSALWTLATVAVGLFWSTAGGWDTSPVTRSLKPNPEYDRQRNPWTWLVATTFCAAQAIIPIWLLIP